MEKKYSVVWQECGQTDYRCRNFFTFLGACLYTYYLDHFKNVAPSIYETEEE